jgi:hypothetical protein
VGGTVGPVSEWSSPTGPSVDSPTYPLGGLAAALRVLFVLAAVLATALAYLAVRMRASLDGVHAGRQEVDAAQRAVDAFLGGASVVFLLTVGIGGLFVVWLWRAARNNQRLGRPGVLGPGWAIGAWFIPVGSLVLPGLQVQQVWKGAESSVARGDPAWRQVRANPQIWIWWLAYVVGQVLTFVGFSLLGPTDDPQGQVVVADLLDHLDDVRRGITLFVAGQVALVLAAALGAAVVVNLSRRQETAVSVLGAGGTPWAGRVSPPAWHPDPTGHYDLRYWDGALWTEHVTRDGQQAIDPL